MILKIVKWVAEYASRISSVNKLKGLPMIPFIGNVHQLKSKYGFVMQIQEYSFKYKNEPVWRLWLGGIFMPNYLNLTKIKKFRPNG